MNIQRFMFAGLFTIASFSAGKLSAQSNSPDAGTYEVISKGSGKCLDVFNHLLSDSAPLAQWDCTGEPHQRFNVKIGVRGVRHITTLRNDFCLSGVDKTNGTRVVQHQDCGDDYNDRYNSDALTFQPNADGTYKVVFDRSGMCLDVRGQGVANGDAVQQWHCNGQTNQDWTFKRVAPIDPAAQYELVSVTNGKCLDVKGKSLVSGTQLQLWECTGGTNQAFTFNESNGDLVMTRPVSTGMNVRVVNDSPENGAAVVQYQYGSRWSASAYTRLVREGWNNSYLVKFEHSAKCLAAAAATDGSPVFQTDCSFGDELQGWILRAK